MFLKILVIISLTLSLTSCFGNFYGAKEMGAIGDDATENDRQLTRRLINQQVFLISAGHLVKGDSIIDVARYETARVTGQLQVNIYHSGITPKWPMDTTIHPVSSHRFIVSARDEEADIYQLYREIMTLPEVKQVEMQLDYSGSPY